jgi:hypothetical protein
VAGHAGGILATGEAFGHRNLPRPKRGGHFREPPGFAATTPRRPTARTGAIIGRQRRQITVSHLTLTGPQVHGAVFGFGNAVLHCHDLRIAGLMNSGSRWDSSAG